MESPQGQAETNVAKMEPEKAALLEGQQDPGKSPDAASKAEDERVPFYKKPLAVFRQRTSVDSGHAPSSSTSSARGSIDKDFLTDESETKEGATSRKASVAFLNPPRIVQIIEEETSSSSAAYKSSTSGSVTIPGQTVIIQADAKSPIQDIAVLEAQRRDGSESEVDPSLIATYALTSARTATPGSVSTARYHVKKRQMPTPKRPEPEHWSAYPHTVIKYASISCIPAYFFWNFYLAMTNADIGIGMGLSYALLSLSLLGCSAVLITLNTDNPKLVLTAQYLSIIFLTPLQIAWLRYLPSLNFFWFLGTAYIFGTMTIMLTEALCRPKDMLLEWRQYWYNMRHHEIIQPTVSFHRETPGAEGTVVVGVVQEESGGDEARPDTQASSRGISAIPESSRATDRIESRVDSRNESRAGTVLQVETPNNIPEDTEALIPADNPA